MYRAVLNLFSAAVETVTRVLLSALVVIISWQVFSRFALNRTPYWAEETALVLVVWFGLLGAGLGVRDGTHLAVEFFARLLPASARLVVHRFVFAVTCCFALVMMISGARLVLMTTEQTLPATHLPVAVSYLAVPISGIFIFLHALPGVALDAARMSAIESAPAGSANEEGGG
ncbi:MAG: TRAP transporter small permease [bacterium]